MRVISALLRLSRPQRSGGNRAASCEAEKGKWGVRQRSGLAIATSLALRAQGRAVPVEDSRNALQMPTVGGSAAFYLPCVNAFCCGNQ